MRLTKLELYGFKSFAKKTEILFDKGTTVIVGPNGSGKSNIADSIRWVLGEQSAKTLRGSKMEDVIFGGTATRKAMSYCEVTLTFDNSDGVLPIDYAEVSITRRVYRSGDSEYCINKTQCRLKDIQELFRDTGLGKEGYSIVGQGKVEEILSNKSGERRKAFEEAAGIMKYRVRKEESERNLDNTRKNLTRLNDIISEITERIDPLREQAEKASTYLKLRDELKELDINLFLHQFDKVKERISNINETVAQIMTEISANESKRAKLSDECAEAEEKERAAATGLNTLSAKLVEMTAGLEEKIGDLKVTDERLLNADNAHASLLQRIEENETRLAELKLRLDDSHSKTDERDAHLAKLAEEFKTAQGMLDETSKLAEEKEAKIEALKNSMIDAANRLGDAKSSISRLTATRESLQKRLDEMQDNSTDITSEESALTGELTLANTELAQVMSEKEAINRNLQEKSGLLNETTFNLNELNSNIHKTEQLLENKKSRLNALMDMKKAHDGYYSSIQKLMADAANDSSLKANIEGTVAELIRVPRRFEVALEMAMGASLQNIVTPDESAAKHVIEYLRRRNYGRATFLPVSTMRPRVLSADERSKVLKVEGCVGIASELIGYLPRYKGIVENLLGRTVIVDNLDTGVKVNRLVGQSLRVATIDGDIINPGGSMTGGSVGKTLNLLGRERECADLLAEIDGLKKQLTEKKAQLESHQAAAAKLSEEISHLANEAHMLDISIAKHKDKNEIISQQLEKVKNRMEQAQNEFLRITDSITDINEQLEKAKTTKEQLSGSSETTQRDIVEAQAQLAVLKGERQQREDKVTDIRIRIASLNKEAAALSGEHERLCADIQQLQKNLEADKLREGTFDDEKNLALQRKAELEKIIASEREKNGELNIQYKELEQRRNVMLEKVDSLRAAKEQCEAELDELKERKHRQEISLSKSETELATMQDRIWADYELTYENALKYRRDIPITSSTQRAGELKREIKELGDINVNAIEEYKSLSERYSTLCTQYDDLRKAEDDLVSLIGELVRQMEINFREKFNQICINFKKVFTELFGGGTAELILSDENDILNCDIDILAQIPGKKLQSLSPLSGGERALTAIALQFAILGLKPTAFCLLDEIDASLDEVNVSRFADYVHVYAQSTQFILITHRKGSMEACNAIYGVAQEEKGVSKIVSARIADAAYDE